MGIDSFIHIKKSEYHVDNLWENRRTLRTLQICWTFGTDASLKKRVLKVISLQYFTHKSRESIMVDYIFQHLDLLCFGNDSFLEM